MPEADLLELFAAPLARIGANYFVTGSVAATLYGEPRATRRRRSRRRSRRN